MKIGMISEHASPLAALGQADAGGQNVHVAALARRLAADGHTVDVYTRRDDPALPERVPLTEGVDVVHVDAGPPEHLPKDELLRWMHPFGDDLAARFSDPEVRPDVLHAHFWMSGLAALRATRRGDHRIPVPVVQTFHALGSVKRRHQGAADTSPTSRPALEQTLCREVDLVVATCRDEVRELHEMGATDDRIRVVPCGVDLGVFTPGTDRTRQVDADRPLRLLSLGRLVERKDVATVVEALARLGEQGPPVELLIAGGPDRDDLARDPEVRRLRRLAEQTGVADRVRFLGAVAHDDVPGLLRSVDVVACTPWYEPFGIVPIEAAACGLPVIASAVGGMLDTVVHERTGLLVPTRDPEAVADALRRLADRRFRLRLGAAARIRAEQRYGWAAVARQTFEAYAEVASFPAVRDHAATRRPVTSAPLVSTGGTR